MSDPRQDGEDYAQGKAQRRMGIFALRRLRGLVDEHERDEQVTKAATRYIALAVLLILLLAIAGFLFSPASVQDIFRSLS